MGYTIYFKNILPKQNKAYCHATIKRFKEFFDQMMIHLNESGEDELVQAVFGGNAVSVNGVGDGEHETFLFAFDEYGKPDFCKTVRKYYTEVVFALLLEMRRLGMAVFSFDGKEDSCPDFAKGVKLYNRVTKSFDYCQVIDQKGTVWHHFRALSTDLAEEAYVKFLGLTIDTTSVPSSCLLPEPKPNNQMKQMKKVLAYCFEYNGKTRQIISAKVDYKNKTIEGYCVKSAGFRRCKIDKAQTAIQIKEIEVDARDLPAHDGGVDDFRLEA